MNSNGLSFSQGFTVRNVGGSTMIDFEADPFSLSNLDFWYTITDALVRTISINGGYFRHALTRYLVPSTTAVALTVSPSYVYLEYSRGSTPTVQVTGDLNVTDSDANTYRKLLFTFLISSSGYVQDPLIHNMGSIEIGSNWA